MMLSLSVRIAESFHSKTTSEMSIDEIADLAASLGYSAICMRASQAGVHSPPEVVASAREAVDRRGLRVSMVTGDFAVPENGSAGPSSLRSITPYLDLAEEFGADLIRVCMKDEEDITYARAAADEARERGIRLAHQSHFASLFETVAGSRETLAAIGRDNFGLIYEPANWFICGEDYLEGIRALAPHIFNVYVQNHRVRTGGSGDDSVETWTRGRVELDHIGVWETGGVDVEAVFRELAGIGYASWVTVHQAFAGVMAPAEAARRSYEYLRPLAARPLPEV